MNLYTQICNKEKLFLAWNSIKSKKSKEKQKQGKDINGESVYDFKINASKRVKSLFNDLKSQTYTPGMLKGFPKAKPRKITKRLIGISTVEDRIVQKTILSVVNPFISPHLNNGVSFGAVARNKVRDTDEEEAYGILGAMKKFKKQVSQEKHWVFKSDIESFYDSIPKEKLYHKTISLLPDNSLNQLIKKIIYAEWGNFQEIKGYLPKNSEIGIAQGPPISPMLSNIYLLQFDSKMKNEYGNGYIRYADDFLILCDSEEKANEAQELSRSLLKEEGLKLSSDKDKTGVFSVRERDMVFLGLRISRNKISPKEPKKYLYRLQELLDAKGDSSKVDKINNYTRGVFEANKNYHSEDLFVKMNIKIEKKKKKRITKYFKLKPLPLEDISLIVEREEWRSYFKRKSSQ